MNGFWNNKIRFVILLFWGFLLPFFCGFYVRQKYINGIAQRIKTGNENNNV